MIDFAIGVVVGAAFSPFWMMVWDKAKALLVSMKK